MLTAFSGRAYGSDVNDFFRRALTIGTPPVFDLQMFAEEGDPSPEPETFKFTFKGQELDLPTRVGEVDLKTLLGSSTAAARKAEQEQARKKAAEYEERLKAEATARAELEARVQAFEEEKLTSAEKAQKAIERERAKYLQELEASKKEAQAYAERYKSHRVQNDLLAALSRYDLVSPEKAALLFRAQYQLDLIQGEDGSDRTVMRISNPDGEDLELSPGEAVEKLLAMPDNAFLLKASQKPGGGTATKGGRAPDGSTIYNQADLKDSKVRREILEKTSRNEKVVIRNADGSLTAA